MALRKSKQHFIMKSVAVMLLVLLYSSEYSVAQTKSIVGKWYVNVPKQTIWARKYIIQDMEHSGNISEKELQDFNYYMQQENVQKMIEEGAKELVGSMAKSYAFQSNGDYFVDENNNGHWKYDSEKNILVTFTSGRKLKFFVKNLTISELVIFTYDGAYFYLTKIKK